MMNMIIRALVGVALVGIVLFLRAGTLARPQAWGFIFWFIGCSLAIGVRLGKTDPLGKYPAPAAEAILKRCSL